MKNILNTEMSAAKFFSYLSQKLSPVFPWTSTGPRARQEEEVRSWVDAIQGDEFEKLKKDIFRIVISTYYQRKFGLTENKAELSVYDMARSEKDLVRFNRMSDEGWRKVIQEMVMGSLDIMQLFEDKKYKGKIQLKVALINIPVLRRASMRIVT